MARLETWYKQDLKRPLVVHKHTDVFNQDSKGNLIGVEVYSDGEPVALSGSISGYCLLADGTTVPAVGASRSGNKASVLIPQTAYSVPGPITITIKNVDGENIATLCATVGIVRQSVSGNLVNPGSVVTDWSNDINAQLQAVQTAVDNVGAIVAAPFDENTVYVVGNYVTNNGNLYRITADHASGVAWASTAKIQCTVGHELEALNNHFVADWNLIDPDAASSEETDFLPVELNIRYNIIHAQSKGRFQYGLSLYDSNKTMLYISQLVDESTDGTNYSYSCTFSESAIAYVKLKINSAPSGIDTTDFSKVYFGKGSEYIEFDDYNVINAIKKVKDDVADLADEISNTQSDVSDLGSALGTVPYGKTAQGQITDNASDIANLKSAFESHFEAINIISGFFGGNFSGSSLTIASRANAVALYFPVVSGKKYTIVKPTATSYWRVGYSSNVPDVGTTLTNYNSSGSTSSTHATYTAPISGYLCAYVYDNSDSGNREAFKNGLYAYEGEYNSNYDVYTAKLSNVTNVPENTGEIVSQIDSAGIIEDYLDVPKKIVSGYGISSDTGNFITISNTSYIEIPVVPGVKISGYTRGGLDVSHGYAFYTFDGVFISGGNQIGAGTYDWNYNVTAPENAFIFRITCNSSHINNFSAEYSNILGNAVKAISSIPQANVFYCGQNRTLNTLKKGIEEATKHMNAVLYVDPGTYDLVQEFGEAWFDALTSSNTLSGLVLKNNIHVIFSPNSKVVSNYTGDNEYAQSLYSPFNAGAYGFTIENLTLECSRCRYGIHDERNGAGEQYKAHYINCNVYIDNSNNDYWGNRACIGGGLGSNAEIIVENCVWKTDDANDRGGVYYHQSNNTSNTDYKSFVCIKDCWFVTGCVQIDDSRTGSTAGKTIYQVNGNSFLKKYSNTNEQGVYVYGMTSPTSEVQAWNNVIRTP